MMIPMLGRDSLSAALRRPATTAALLLAIGSQQAWADAYADSFQHISSMAFGNAQVFAQQTSNAIDSAEFAGFGLDTATDPVDPRQAQSGPGPFPGENYFIHPFGRVGQYARADDRINSTSTLSMAGENVAEAYRTSPGAAGSRATTSFSFSLQPVSDSLPISISFRAQPYQEISTALSGESSTARISFAVIVQDADLAVLLRWRPNGNPLTDFTITSGVVTNVQDPFTLQSTLNCVDACGQVFDQSGSFTLSYRSAQSQTLNVSVVWTESVDITAVGPPVPEPPSMALWLTALPGLAWWVRRRTQARLRTPDAGLKPQPHPAG